MKFSQLIEYNMRNIFLENDPQSVGDASPRPFSKNPKLSISLDVMEFVFVVCPSRGLPKYIKTKVLSICLYLIKNIFTKQIEV